MSHLPKDNVDGIDNVPKFGGAMNDDHFQVQNYIPTEQDHQHLSNDFTNMLGFNANQQQQIVNPKTHQRYIEEVMPNEVSQQFPFECELAVQTSQTWPKYNRNEEAVLPAGSNKERGTKAISSSSSQSPICDLFDTIQFDDFLEDFKNSDLQVAFRHVDVLPAIETKPTLPDGTGQLPQNVKLLEFDGKVQNYKFDIKFPSKESNVISLVHSISGKQMLFTKTNTTVPCHIELRGLACSRTDQDLQVQCTVCFESLSKRDKAVEPCENHKSERKLELISQKSIIIVAKAYQPSAHSWSNSEDNVAIRLRPTWIRCVDTAYETTKFDVEFLCRNSCFKRKNLNMIIEVLYKSDIIANEEIVLSLTEIPLRSAKEFLKRIGPNCLWKPGNERAVEVMTPINQQRCNEVSRDEGEHTLSAAAYDVTDKRKGCVAMTAAHTKRFREQPPEAMDDREENFTTAPLDRSFHEKVLNECLSDQFFKETLRLKFIDASLKQSYPEIYHNVCSQFENMYFSNYRN